MVKSLTQPCQRQQALPTAERVTVHKARTKALMIHLVWLQIWRDLQIGSTFFKKSNETFNNFLNHSWI